MTTKVVKDGQAKGAVTDEQLGRLSKRQNDLYFRINKGAVIYQPTMAVLQLLAENKAVEILNAMRLKSSISFDELLILKTERMLSRAFSKKIIVDSLPVEFTEENLAKWALWNLRPIFLPDENLQRCRFLRNWTTKPDIWFYDKIEEEKIFLSSLCLIQGWYLADFTRGVNYTDGTQIFPNDPLAPIIERLRIENKIGQFDNTPLGSRFAITFQEWQLVLSEFSNKLSFKSEQVSLERCIESNAISNIYDKSRMKFNMWEWLADDVIRSGNYRLLGRAENFKMNMGVIQYPPDKRDNNFAGRPLVSFAKK